ncbi:MAG: NAD(P)H-binding protein [Thermoflexales bacterium]|nr:NAD(P)H-binding protein [Thermoflexales bacterium]
MRTNLVQEVDVVTGAFSYTGKYIAQRLLAQGRLVRTLTGHTNRVSPFGVKVDAFPFNFDRPSELVRSLQGVTTLYNTYWVRFTHGSITFDEAVENTQKLIRAAVEAGVKRFVHVSITNPHVDSPLPYFKGKGLLEQVLMNSKLSYAIIRPTVIFGDEDILINNIAWLLRHFPLFVIPGDGEYRLQPISADDMADLAVTAGQRRENEIVDAVGPEIYTFETLVKLIAQTVRSRSLIVHLPPKTALTLSQFIGRFVKDVVLTQEEVDGLMSNLLVVDGPPTGRTRLSDWLREHAATVGKQYASELARHYRG